MRYRRAKARGGTFFFTVVTFKRMRILTKESNVDSLRESLKHVIESHPFKIAAFVLLPDHLHCIWTLPEHDSDFSTRWRLIKTRFTRKCDDRFKHEAFESRKRKKEQTVWQRRFWEHQIRDELDFQKHVEYIHYNPVHHKYARRPIDWPYSSFHRYGREGKYDAAWMSHIIHSNSPETCRKLIKKTAEVLEPGGIMLIHDFFLQDDQAGPLFPALFALNMLMNI